MDRAPAQGRFSLGHTFTAFRYRNYRLWFFGQLFSLFGTWMQSTAEQYLVYELTGSEAFLGYVAVAALPSTLLFMLYAGVIADRVPRRTLMLITQTAMMLLAFTLMTLTATGLIQPWHILVLASLLGVANAFDTPARQAFILEMVDREDLTNAIALNGTMFNLSAVLGPALGGIIYALVGPAWCFLFNGVSFLAVILALALMRDLTPQPRAPRIAAGKQLAEALRYVLHEPVVRTIFATVGLIGLFGISFTTLLPAWAVDVLHGDSRTYGFLGAARAGGAVISALMLASLGRFKFKGKLWTVGTWIVPPLLLSFAFVRSLGLSLLLLAGVGFGTVLVFNLSNTLVQTLAPDALRGRVMGAYGLTFFGLMPLGGLLAGGAAELLGAPPVVVIGATACMAMAAALFVFMPQMRALE